MLYYSTNPGVRTVVSENTRRKKNQESYFTYFNSLSPLDKNRILMQNELRRLTKIARNYEYENRYDGLYIGMVQDSLECTRQEAISATLEDWATEVINKNGLATIIVDMDAFKAIRNDLVYWLRVGRIEFKGIHSYINKLKHNK